MQVDDEFVRELFARGPKEVPGDMSDEEHCRIACEIILAVAAERGLLVPEGAQWMNAVRTARGDLLLLLRCYRALPGDELVRVAIVEVKE